MLMGEYTHSMDAKGRVSLPADFRVVLGDSFVITKGLDNCLFVYDLGEWQRLSEKLAKLPISKAEVRSFVRFFFAGARKTECDKQGRFLVPANLRSYAKLDKEAVLIGVSNRVEIWSRTEWERYSDAVSPAVTEIAETLTELGI